MRKKYRRILHTLCKPEKIQINLCFSRLVRSIPSICNVTSVVFFSSNFSRFFFYFVFSFIQSVSRISVLFVDAVFHFCVCLCFFHTKWDKQIRKCLRWPPIHTGRNWASLHFHQFSVFGCADIGNISISRCCHSSCHSILPARIVVFCNHYGYGCVFFSSALLNYIVYSCLFVTGAVFVLHFHSDYGFLSLCFYLLSLYPLWCYESSWVLSDVAHFVPMMKISSHRFSLSEAFRLNSFFLPYLISISIIQIVEYCNPFASVTTKRGRSDGVPSLFSVRLFL